VIPSFRPKGSPRWRTHARFPFGSSLASQGKYDDERHHQTGTPFRSKTAVYPGDPSSSRKFVMYHCACGLPLRLVFQVRKSRGRQRM
jgi:hypothetical protein